MPDASQLAPVRGAPPAVAADVVLRVAGLRKLYGSNEVVRGFSEEEVRQFLGFLRSIQKNLSVQLEGADTESGDVAEAEPIARAALS